MDYKELFEQSPACCLVIRPDLMIVAVTDAYLTATMTKRGGIIGKGLFEAFPDNPEDADADGVSNLRASLNRVLEYKKPDTMAIQKYDIRRPESEGGQFEVRYWSPVNIPVLAEDGNVKLIIHRVEDVTEFVLLQKRENEQKEANLRLKSRANEMEIEILKRNKQVKDANIELERVNDSLLKRTEELKKSNELLTSFAATASHDIKAPFRTVGGYLDIIKQIIGDQIAQPELSEAFERISLSRDRIANLLDDLLQFARVTGYKQPPSKVDLNMVLDDVLKNLEYNLSEKKASVVIKDRLPEIQGHYTLLTQLLQNLIGNAIKFQDKEDPRVVISVSQNEDNYQFSIQDNGIGIEAEYFEKIFQVFERLHDQREFQGSGLGLSICERIVAHHGGKIWVESEIGMGTTFHFTLSRK